jgi:hypothetical protein
LEELPDTGLEIPNDGVEKLGSDDEAVPDLIAPGGNRDTDPGDGSGDDNGGGHSPKTGKSKAPLRSSKKQKLWKQLMSLMISLEDSDIIASEVEIPEKSTRPRLARKEVLRYKKGPFVNQWIKFRKEVQNWTGITP